MLDTDIWSAETRVKENPCCGEITFCCEIQTINNNKRNA